MKLGDVLKKAGAAIVRQVVPGGGLIVDLVNNFLPKEKKLHPNATGEEITGAVSSLPPSQQAELFMKEIDVEIAEINSWTQIQHSLSEADKAGSSTRPQIALMMARIVSFVILAFSAMWIVAIFRDQTEMVAKLADAWPLMLTVIATPTALLRAYFGMRSKEKKNRYGVIAGQPPQTNMLGEIIKLFKK